MFTLDNLELRCNILDFIFISTRNKNINKLLHCMCSSNNQHAVQQIKPIFFPLYILNLDLSPHILGTWKTTNITLNRQGS